MFTILHKNGGFCAELQTLWQEGVGVLRPLFSCTVVVVVDDFEQVALFVEKLAADGYVGYHPAVAVGLQRLFADRKALLNLVAREIALAEQLRRVRLAHLA